MLRALWDWLLSLFRGAPPPSLATPAEVGHTPAPSPPAPLVSLTAEGGGALPLDDDLTDEPAEVLDQGGYEHIATADAPAQPYGAVVHPEHDGDQLPVDTSGYGRRHSSSGTTWAIDVALPQGWSVYSPGPAKVTRVSDESDPYNGIGVWLTLLSGPLAGETIALIHLSRRDVDFGVEVERGSVGGLTGNTGKSSGPHLHAELSGDADPMDTKLFNWRDVGWTWKGW